MKLTIWPRRAAIESVVVRVSPAEVQNWLASGGVTDYREPGTTHPSFTLIVEATRESIPPEET